MVTYTVVDNNEMVLFVNKEGKAINSKKEWFFRIPTRFLSDNVSSRSYYFSDKHCFMMRCKSGLCVFDVRYAKEPYFTTSNTAHVTTGGHIYTRIGKTLRQYSIFGKLMSTIKMVNLKPLMYGILQVHGEFIDLFCDNHRIRYKQ